MNSQDPEVAEASLAAAAPSRPDDAVALVLVNLGTPSAPEPGPVRAFLREFLSDRRVIEMNPFLWKPILEGIILRVRPREVSRKYRSIWLEQGSPLMHYTREQARLLGERLPGVRVEVAMRYGQLSIGAALDRLHAQGVRRVAVLPAYPHYSATTVASINDAVCAWIGRNRDGFEMRLHRSFPASPAYIDALAVALEAHWEREGRPNFLAGERVVVSFHSIPVAMDQAGDPYRAECRRTVAAPEARRWGRSRRHSRASSAAPSGWDRRQSRKWRGSGASTAPASTSYAQDLRPTAWRRWRRSTSSTARPSPRRGAGTTTTCRGRTRRMGP